MTRRLLLRFVLPTVVFGLAITCGTMAYETYNAYPAFSAERAAEASALVTQIEQALAAQETYYHDRVRQSLALIQAEAMTIGQPRLSRTVRVGDIEVPNLYFGLYRQGNRFAIVDYATQIQPGLAELYVLTDGQFVSVSTTRLHADGERAVGQRFDLTSLAQADAYWGPATLEGTTYYLAIEPMRNAQGAVIGRWVAGIPFDAWDTLAVQLASWPQAKTHAIAVHDATQQALVSIPPAENLTATAIRSDVHGTFAPWGLEITVTYATPPLAAVMAAQFSTYGWRMGLAGVAVSVLLWGLLYSRLHRPFARFQQAVTSTLAKSQPPPPSTAHSLDAWATSIATTITHSQTETEEANQHVQRLQTTLANHETAQREHTSTIEAHAMHRSALTHALHRLAERDFSVQLPTSDAHAFTPAYTAYNQAVVAQQRLHQDLQTALGATHQTAADIASATDQLAAASHEQSLQTEEVVAAVSEMTATIAENAANANQAATIARESGQEATSGGAIVEQTIAKIREIADVFTDSSASIAQLHDSSQQISQIVALITDIAEQTNLLALNAAIEAARAGEHGKSFAVVAGEVRGLASRTQEATTEIAQMIARIQGETTEAVRAMERGTQEVQEGLRLADATGTALQHIVDRAHATETTVIQIAAANEEQSATSDEIARNIGTIATVTSEASGEVARIAEAATSLRVLTEELQTLVHQPKATIHTLHHMAQAA